MRRASILVAVLVLAVAGGGCASASKEHAPLLDPSKGGDRRADDGVTTPAPKPGDTTIQGDAAHGRPPESRDEKVAAEAERGVALPDALEVAAAPSLPERPRVAVAFVRGGKLVRRGDALRRLAHDFTKDARIEALERFEEGAPSQLSLDNLCERAAKQGALLLLVDARATDDDADRTTLVLSTAVPYRALAFTRPKTTAPAGQELVARLVRTSRT